MAKKKEQRQLVTAPQVGQSYIFNFAGGPLTGILESKHDKLTGIYGHAWFWIRVPAENSFTGSSRVAQAVRYPVSIYNILSEYNVQ